MRQMSGLLNNNTQLEVTATECQPNDKGKVSCRLQLTEATIVDMENFCKRLFVLHDRFVELLTKFELEKIGCDIDAEDYDSLTTYLGLTKIVTSNSNETEETESKKTQEITVAIGRKVCVAVNEVCKLIRWKPERFIEEAVGNWIEELKERITDKQLEFLQVFLDFSPASDAIEEALKGGY